MLAVATPEKFERKSAREQLGQVRLTTGGDATQYLVVLIQLSISFLSDSKLPALALTDDSPVWKSPDA
jgi:hypothetical protein